MQRGRNSPQPGIHEDMNGDTLTEAVTNDTSTLLMNHTGLMLSHVHIQPAIPHNTRTHERARTHTQHTSTCAHTHKANRRSSLLSLIGTHRPQKRHKIYPLYPPAPVYVWNIWIAMAGLYVCGRQAGTHKHRD